MDIQKHLEATNLSFRELLFKFVSQQFNLISSVIPAFSIIISKEMAVHIFALQIRSVIASDNPIRVNHRQNPNLINFSEFIWQYIFRHKVVHKPMNYKATMCFTRVLSSNNNYNWLWLKGISIIVYIRYFYNWDVYLAQTLTQSIKPYNLIVFYKVLLVD